MKGGEGIKAFIKLLKNKSGVTLIELIIAFALLGLVSLSIIGLMTTGANSFRRISSEVNLQSEAQLAMSQLQEYVIDCNGGVCFADDVLYIADFQSDNEGSGLWLLHCFRWDTAKAALYYWKGTVTNGDDAPPSCTLPDESSDDWALMAEYVGAFGAQLGTISGGSKPFCKLTLTMTTAGRDYMTEEMITFRNPVITAAADCASWLQLVCG